MVLAATFEKDGDIITNCLHKSASVKALLLEVVCSIFQRLLSGSSAVDISEMKDIENGVSDAEAANLEVSWLQDHLARFLLVEKTGQWSSLLKEVKANTLLVSKAATHDLKQRQVELLAAQERAEKAQRCMEVPKLVTILYLFVACGQSPLKGEVQWVDL
ncbi:hypothetical protein RJ639_019694 [Escallonia herrerae]|uniref:Uncharacterized protein n=1 Tax=Escallonia herrerae TaxID=1293975 RepID=A0AA88VAT0_9ASTE|nr:hypothetical protein RJ639_019694 [Escallonia herrerae]